MSVLGNGKSSKYGLIFFFATLFLIFSDSSIAQMAPLPPELPVFDSNDVDILSGQSITKTKDVFIGYGDSEISWERYFGNTIEHRSNYLIDLTFSTDSYYEDVDYATFSWGLSSETFIASQGAYYPPYSSSSSIAPNFPSSTSKNLAGGSISGTSSEPIYTRMDGVKVFFEYLGHDGWMNIHNWYYKAKRIELPNGKIININYTNYGVGYARLDNITNNYGYMLKYIYNYNQNPSESKEAELAWSTPNKVMGINRSVQSCLVENSCPNNFNWAHSTFSHQHTQTGSSSVTIETFSRAGDGETTWRMENYKFKIKPPLQSSYVTEYELHPGYYNPEVDTDLPAFVKKVTKGNMVWLYNRADADTYGLEWGKLTVTNPDLSQEIFLYEEPIVGPNPGNSNRPFNPILERPQMLNSWQDATGRLTSYYYDNNHRPVRVVYPELNEDQYVYDSRGNVLEHIIVPKPGSSSTSLKACAYYNGQSAASCAAVHSTAACSNPKTCNKPTTVIDARGNVTNYTYAPEHGGMLSEMLPAPSAGEARPLKRITWTQRHAWVLNSAGVLVQESSPIWLQSTETQCQTVSGSNPSPVCDSSARKVVTTYEYGANGTGESLLVKGVKVVADGTTVRTCYAYDIYGRKISETKPRAGLSSCP